MCVDKVLYNRAKVVSLAPKYRNWGEISSDSSTSSPGVTGDDDSTPDTDIGKDLADPNDAVVNHNDPKFDNDEETPLPGDGHDEDDNDYEDVRSSSSFPPVA